VLSSQISVIIMINKAFINIIDT